MTKELLSQYRALDGELKSLEETMERLRAKAESPGIIITDMPSTPPSILDRMAETIARLNEVMEQYNAKWDALIDLRQEIEAAIEGLPSTDRSIMRMRYIEGYTWERIGFELNYSKAHIHRLHANALVQLGAA